MSEFKAIETQEELDAIIKARLDRNTKTVTDEVKKSYEGYVSPDEVKKLTEQVDTLTKQLTEKDTAITDLTAKNKSYETASVKARIAHEKGLPFELADRLSGETEQEITADAEKLAQYMGKPQPTAPLFAQQGQSTANTTESAYLSMFSELAET